MSVFLVNNTTDDADGGLEKNLTKKVHETEDRRHQNLQEAGLMMLQKWTTAVNTSRSVDLPVPLLLLHRLINKVSKWAALDLWQFSLGTCNFNGPCPRRGGFLRTEEHYVDSKTASLMTEKAVNKRKKYSKSYRYIQRTGIH